MGCNSLDAQIVKISQISPMNVDIIICSGGDDQSMTTAYCSVNVSLSDRLDDRSVEGNPSLVSINHIVPYRYL